MLAGKEQVKTVSNAANPHPHPISTSMKYIEYEERCGHKRDQISSMALSMI